MRKIFFFFSENKTWKIKHEKNILSFFWKIKHEKIKYEIKNMRNIFFLFSENKIWKIILSFF
jgi:hypothetical protein